MARWHLKISFKWPLITLVCLLGPVTTFDTTAMSRFKTFFFRSTLICMYTIQKVFLLILILHACIHTESSSHSCSSKPNFYSNYTFSIDCVFIITYRNSGHMHIYTQKVFFYSCSSKPNYLNCNYSFPYDCVFIIVYWCSERIQYVCTKIPPKN